MSNGIGNKPPTQIVPPQTGSVDKTASVGSVASTSASEGAGFPVYVPQHIADEAMKIANPRAALQFLAENVPIIKLALANGMGEAHKTAEQNDPVNLLREAIG